MSSAAGLPDAPPASHKVELVLAQLESLPTLAPVALRLLELTSRPDADARLAARLIESDAALTARMLSLLSRADRAVDRRSATVERAVVLLGLPTVRQVVITTQVVDAFDPARGAAGGLDRREFWKHCLAVACGARRLAAAAGASALAEDAFIAGLLHDLGKIALDAAVSKSYERVLREQARRRGDLLETERAVLGTDHTVAGRRLAERWGLPAAMCECIWLHHLPPDALPAEVHSSRLIHFVWLADLIARLHHFGYSGNPTGAATLTDAAPRAGIDAALCARIAAELPNDIAERAEWIGLDDLDSGRLYMDALAESSRALAGLNQEVSTRNRRLERTAACFEAMAALHRDATPRSGAADLCASIASAAAMLFEPASVLVYQRDEAAGGLHCGACASGDRPAESAFLTGAASRTHADETHAAAAAALGTPMIPAPACTSDAADAFRPVIGGGPLWLLPLVNDGRWIGGALLSGAVRPESVREERAEVEAFARAAGLLLNHSAEHARAQRLGESLAWAQQKLASAQLQLAAAASLRMTAEMAAGAAHELNTPLAIISGRAQLLRGGTADPAQAASLDEIVRNAARASDIIADLLAFAEPAAPRPEMIDVAAAARDAAQEWSRGEPSRNIRVEAHDPAIAARCDRGHLQSTLIELFKNAAEAAAGGSGNILVKTSLDASDEIVAIDVIDDGRGMPPEVRERAFSPFFSHRPAGRGRGMGLAHAQRWMRANGGDIRLEAAPGGGTIARIRLPRAR